MFNVEKNQKKSSIQKFYIEREEMQIFSPECDHSAAH